MKKWKRGAWGCVWLVWAGWAWAQQAPESIPKPPQALIEYQMRLSQFEQQQESMRREMELMRTRMEHLRVQREFEAQVGKMQLPSVVAIYHDTHRPQALLRDAAGLSFHASIGHKIGAQARIARIDADAVWVEIEKGSGKKRKTEEVMLPMAQPPQGVPSGVGAVAGAAQPLPMPPLPMPPAAMGVRP